MPGPVSAFARYSQEVAAPAQTDTVLPASRKRKRMSMATTNGHSDESPPSKNRSKSLQPLVSISETNGQSRIIEQPCTIKKTKTSETKFLSPAYPTPYPQRHVTVSGARHSHIEKPTLEEKDETADDDDNSDDDDEEDDSEGDDDQVRNHCIFYEIDKHFF